MRQIDLLVVHCTGTPNGQPFAVAEIDRLHAEFGVERSAVDVALTHSSLRHILYHYVIYSAGVVVAGRGLEEPGVLPTGRSLDICLVGTDHYKPEQWVALRNLVCAAIARLARRVDLRAPSYIPSPPDALALAKVLGVRICGAREQIKTESPGFDVQSWLAGGMEALSSHLFEEVAWTR